ncbi:hypothetical protein [Hymenobacter yonginensis]|uniref:DUF4890 domain-containing protein n=1 Tax=Hymenobacter yonginensis TaxID=748197 RepID=A0ABY7PPK8_9BACT|nr:hypothetical protein [Hymenobacter yonginensis]WBO85202.1 hypothetical protein O9Z63_02930 [Hymenobacter yonginensis]
MLVLLAAVALSASAASAQTTPAPTSRMGAGRMQDAARTPEQRAEMQTKRLTQQLALSAEQSAKVQTIALAENQELQALRGKYASADNRKGAGQELKAVQEKYDAQLKGVFTAEQYAKYSQMREDRQEKRKEGRTKQKS